MSVLFIMAPAALVLAGVAIAAFIWATRDGQFDDVDTPQHRVLFDDPPIPAATKPDRAEAANGEGLRRRRDRLRRDA